MIRTRTATLVTASLGVLALTTACARGHEPATAASEHEPMTPAAGRRPPTAQAARPAPEPATRAVDPAVIADLNQMGAFLRSQQAFAIRAETAIDEILDSGQKLQFGEVVEMWIRRPDGMRVNYVSDRKQRQFFFDGSTFTLYGPKSGFYASFAAPPTLRELIDALERRYQIEMPLVDLFYWGTDKSGLDQVTAASDLGPSRVGDVPCHHYALQQDDVDWQIWVERGERKLPRKFVITSKREFGQPQFSAVLGWNLKPALEQTAFTFVPPKGAQRIVFEQVAAARGPGR
jgi:hypothetical protein